MIFPMQLISILTVSYMSPEALTDLAQSAWRIHSFENTALLETLYGTRHSQRSPAGSRELTLIIKTTSMLVATINDAGNVDGYLVKLTNDNAIPATGGQFKTGQ